MKFKYILISIILILLLSIFIYLLIPFKIKTPSEIKYAQKFSKENYKITRLGYNYTNNTTVSGKVNTKKIGTYILTYKTKLGIITFHTQKKIKVIDKTKPIIKLKGNSVATVCPNKNYKEEGYIALDNYDGDITKKVKKETTKTKIIYTVKDTSGNKTTISRNLTHQDKIDPDIKLKGMQYVYISKNSPYKEEGVTAIDNCDGDISKKITTKGNVNTKKAGTYKIKYIASDDSHNKKEIERTIFVAEDNEPIGTGTAATIYLTFDDGPKIGTTNIILDILKEENIKATFFVTNNGPDELIKREFKEGHTVALHTSSHNYQSVYSSVDNFFNDLNQVSKRVENITNIESKIIRFPGGSSNTVSKKYSPGIMTKLAKETEEKGYIYFDWNITSGDAGETKNPVEVYNNIIKNLSKDHYNIILMHDTAPWTRDALKNIIKYGKQNGYNFDRITTNTKPYHQQINN